jgi:hypothetical protein
MGMVWLLVRVKQTNQNASPAPSRDVLAARPTRATHDRMNDNRTASFNLQPNRMVMSISHKV